MVFVDETIAVADAAAKTDLASGKEWQKSPYNRILGGFALTGGNAADQVILEAKINGVIQATMRNPKTGLVVDMSQDWRPVGGVIIPANSEFKLIVNTAPTVNPIKLLLNLMEVP